MRTTVQFANLDEPGYVGVKPIPLNHAPLVSLGIGPPNAQVNQRIFAANAFSAGKWGVLGEEL